MDSDTEPKIYALALFIAIAIGIITGIWSFSARTSNKAISISCQEHCRYEAIKKEEDYLGSLKAESQYAWSYYLNPNSVPERNFETKEQCIDYCLRNK